MHISKILFSLALAALPLSAQKDHNLVTNGEFTGTLAPWVLGGGYSLNPALDTTYATNGYTVSDSFGCGPGGLVTPAPYPANTIEQTITVVNGLTYELRCDVSSSRATSTGTNSDAGTIYVEVNAIEVARVAFGSITINETKRAQLCARFQATTTGSVTLKFFFARTFLANSGTPRVNLDNVSVEDITGPVYCIKGNRKVNTSVPFTVDGEPSALYATFIAAGRLPSGLAVGGFNGLWYLDFASTNLFLNGSLDASGKASTSILIPNDPILLTVPLYHQAVTIGSTREFSSDFACVMTK